MTRKTIAPESLCRFPTAYSPAVKAGPWLFISGQIAVDKEGNTLCPGDMLGQAEIIFQEIETIVTEAGGSMADIVEVNYYVTDAEEFKKISPLRARYFNADPMPASTAVEISRLVNEEWLIEISATAYIESD